MNHFLKREMVRNHIFSFLAWADLKLSLWLYFYGDFFFYANEAAKFDMVIYQ